MAENKALHQLLMVIEGIAREYGAAKLVLQAVVETHPEREALLARVTELAALRQEVDLGQPLTAEEIADRQAMLAKWMRWIELGPPSYD
jgi:hypothetical protein